jgi:competence protein ComEC
VSILFSLVYVFTARRKWLTALIGLPALLLFAALAGFSPSITRACIMHGLAVIALLCEREYDPPSALSFAVLCMLAANPWTITNVGFQLSVACLTGILFFSSPIQQWLLDSKRLGHFRGWKARIVKWFAASVSLSLSASLLTAPLSALHFGMVSLIGLLTNLLTLWIISFIFYGILLALALSCLFVPLGFGVGWVIAWPIRYILWVSKWMASFPLAAVYTNNVLVIFWLILVYILLAVFCLQKRKHPLVLSICAGFSLCVVLLLSWTAPQQDDLRMTVLDVGQGQCILLQSEGKNYLVDCGGDSDVAAADAAAALLLSQGIDHLDGLIITHYDSDHAAGAVLLLQRIRVDVLYLPNSPDTNGIGQALRSNSGSEVISIRQDVQIRYGAVSITLIPSESGDSSNESGLSVLFQRENCDILITGDRSAKGERELLRDYDLPDLEVLIVGHHGSKYSTCRELLIKTRPDIAIISVGADNQFGHPTEEVLQRLDKYGCVVYRTDRDGTVIYRG